MGQYRPSRAIEASIIDYIIQELIGNWDNVAVEKSFARIYSINLPSICIRLSDTTHTNVEVGSTATYRTPLVLIDLFCENDGQRLDLKDFLVETLKGGLPYYNYTIAGGKVINKVQDGRIRVISISDTPIDLGVDKDKLDPRDRYRHILTLSVSLGKVES